MRRLVANWKMQGSLALCDLFIKDLKARPDIETIICPPNLYAHYLLERSTNFSVGVQDSSAFSEGAHTGEISPEMLKDLGIKYAIIGHSERGEDRTIVLRKLERLLSQGIKPLLCLASLEDYFFFLPHLSEEVIIAYEPVTAIGTGIIPPLDDLLAIVNLLKTSPCQVLYGGSVKDNNILELYTKLKPDGFLVGGASLDLSSFQKMLGLLTFVL